MNEENKFDPPNPSLGDKAHALVRSALGAIPLVGQATIELFTALVTPSLEKRRGKWMEDIGSELSRLAFEKRVNLEDLKGKEAFIDIIMDASQAALRNSNEEKREALKNAVINAALPSPPDESLQHMFIRWVDEMTVWHLRLLKLFHNPKAWAEKRNHRYPSFYAAGLSNILESAYPDLKDQRNFYDQVWKELHQRGLINTDSLHSTMTEHGLYASRTSEIGKKFLQYVERPD